MTDFECHVVGRLQTNCYLICDGNNVGVIDPGAEASHIIEVIRGKVAEPNVSILLTHGHVDQIQAVPDIVNEFPGTLIYACEAENLFLFDSSVNLSRHAGSGLTFAAISDNLRKVHTDDRITIGHCELRVLETPGHTPGSLTFVCDAKCIAFCGDTILKEGIGGTNLPFGDEATLFDSIQQKILALPPEMRLLPSHGESTRVGHEREHNPYILNMGTKKPDSHVSAPTDS
jgi:glyoxylase-like metal-dependent hydrolase (beta-lactamase superfamily II)